MSEELQERRPVLPRRERPLTQEEVLKRNFVERIKPEKHPFDVIDDLPALIEMPLRGRSPKRTSFACSGTACITTSRRSGIHAPGEDPRRRADAREAADHRRDLATSIGRGYGELTTRQYIQLHWIELALLPEIFEILEAAGLTTAGACGDNVRNITGCPVAGIDGEELFDATP